MKLNSLNIPITFDAGAALDINNELGEISTRVQSAEGSISDISQKADSINLSIRTDLNSSGINLTDKTITLSADTTFINNGDTTVAAFQNGYLNASLINAESINTDNITVTKLETTGDGEYASDTSLNKAHIKIEDGLIMIYGEADNPNIVIGYDTDKNSAVLRYYDNSNVLLYDLGPDGIETMDVQDEELINYNWCVTKFYNSGEWYVDDFVSFFSIGNISDGSGYTYNGNAVSYLAYLMKNSAYVENGNYDSIYLYKAKYINGMYVGGTNTYAESDTAAEKYNNTYLKQAPSTINQLTLNSGEVTSDWTFTGIKINRIQIWYTYSGIDYTIENGIYYAIPDDYNTPFERGDDVDFSIDITTGYYNSPIVYVNGNCYENGKIVEEFDITESQQSYYFNIDKIEGINYDSSTRTFTFNF